MKKEAVFVSFPRGLYNIFQRRPSLSLLNRRQDKLRIQGTITRNDRAYWRDTFARADKKLYDNGRMDWGAANIGRKERMYPSGEW